MHIDDVWAAFKREPASQELRNMLVQRYFPLVRQNAERVWSKLPNGFYLDTLLSAGVFSLFGLIDMFNRERDDVKFEIYCVPRLRLAMLDACAE